MKSKWRKIRMRTIVVHLLAWSVALIWMIPFLGVLNTATRPASEVSFGWWQLNPYHPTLDNFIKALTQPVFSISKGYVNSLIIAVPATLVPIFVAALAGYGFCRFTFPMRDYLFLSIVLLMSVPAQMVAIPVFQIMVNLDLVDNQLSLILVHTAWGLPWIILFMRNFFTALPLEVEEAARVDGASDLKIFFRIVLPMAIPAFASAGILQFMWVWNDFFFALILIYTADKMPATLLVPKLAAGQQLTDWGLLSAGSILVLIVPLALYVLLQKYYIRGMIGWTIKG
ncbi:MAG TPA: carbohydrate ABC transporter permease [Thermoplasmata archaeon]